MENKLFINDNCEDFDRYKENLLKQDFDKLVAESGVCCQGTIIHFATTYNNTEIDGNKIQKGDLLFLIPAYDLAIEPFAQDPILMGSEYYTVIDVKKVAPSNDAILYKVQVRGA